MNRSKLQQLAEDRIVDAECLLAGGRPSGAFYLAGYAVECGLKACILAYVETSGVIFEEKKFSEKCWTHDLEELLKLAKLEAKLNADATTNAPLSVNWATVIVWNEISRYEQKTPAEAQKLYDAIANNPHGVLPWIRLRW